MLHASVLTFWARRCAVGFYTGRNSQIPIASGGPRLSEVKVPYSSAGLSLLSACDRTKSRASSPTYPFPHPHSATPGAPVTTWARGLLHCPVSILSIPQNQKVSRRPLCFPTRLSTATRWPRRQPQCLLKDAKEMQSQGVCCEQSMVLEKGAAVPRGSLSI